MNFSTDFNTGEVNVWRNIKKISYKKKYDKKRGFSKAQYQLCGLS